MNIWQKKKVTWLAICSYYYIIYTNIQIIITLKLNLIILSWKKILLKSLIHFLIKILKDAGYFIPVSIKSFTNLLYQNVCDHIYVFLSSKTYLFPNQQWYEMTLTLIESRIYNPSTSKAIKTLYTLYFVNNDMHMVNINKIIYDKNLMKSYLYDSAKTIYTLSKRLQSKIFNKK